MQENFFFIFGNSPIEFLGLLFGLQFAINYLVVGDRWDTFA